MEIVTNIFLTYKESSLNLVSRETEGKEKEEAVKREGKMNKMCRCHDGRH